MFDCNADLRSPQSPGNLYSQPQKIHFDPAQGGTWKLELTKQIPPEQLPADTEQIKFVKIHSRRLSEFYGRPIFLRAGVVLPRDYAREPSRRYPLWVRIGGLDTRYTSVLGLMGEKSDSEEPGRPTTPRALSSSNSTAPAPTAIPTTSTRPTTALTATRSSRNSSRTSRPPSAPSANRARVSSPAFPPAAGSASALQVFYPDFFNGAWSSCPDPVDFRALELVDIYKDDNAYVNQYGNERPSARDHNGDVETHHAPRSRCENLLGRGNSYTLSGEQWGDWNAVFGPRGADGRPVPLWDPQTGKINHAVAEQWKKYDLRLVLETNWKTLGPKLRGKLHIAAGEADDYFLNNAVHLLDRFLAKADPPFAGKIVYGPGQGHGWSTSPCARCSTRCRPQPRATDQAPRRAKGRNGCRTGEQPKYNRAPGQWMARSSLAPPCPPARPRGPMSHASRPSSRAHHRQKHTPARDT